MCIYVYTFTHIHIYMYILIYIHTYICVYITDKNYLSLILDVEIHLEANALGDTIKEGNKASNWDKAKTMIFLRHHLYKRLKA